MYFIFKDWNEKNNFFISFFVNSALFEFFYRQKLFYLSKTFLLKLIVNRVLPVWTKVCQQTFGDWEVQTMWNFQKNEWCPRGNMFYQKKNVYKWIKLMFITSSLTQKDRPWSRNTLTFRKRKSSGSSDR